MLGVSVVITPIILSGSFSVETLTGLTLSWKTELNRSISVMEDGIPGGLQHYHETCCEKGGHHGRRVCMVQRWHHHGDVVFRTGELVYNIVIFPSSYQIILNIYITSLNSSCLLVLRYNWLTQHNPSINYRFYQFLTIFKKKNQLNKILISEPLQKNLIIPNLFNIPNLESEFLFSQPHITIIGAQLSKQHE